MYQHFFFKIHRKTTHAKYVPQHYVYIRIRGSGTYPYTLLSKRKYTKTKRSTSEYARTVRPVVVTLSIVWGDF